MPSDLRTPTTPGLPASPFPGAPPPSAGPAGSPTGNQAGAAQYAGYEAALDEYVRDRAAARGISPEALLAEAADPSAIAGALDRAAERSGLSPHAYLTTPTAAREDAQAYPGPHCLDPYDVERYARDGGLLSVAGRHHLEACAGCAALVDALAPHARGAPDHTWQGQMDRVAERVVAEARRRAAERADRLAPAQGGFGDLRLRPAAPGRARGGGPPHDVAFVLAVTSAAVSLAYFVGRVLRPTTGPHATTGRPAADLRHGGRAAAGTR
jgi:hypothetical protein